jgi:tripartite-type tricarboxylate transporter receptor subunit TctC
MAGLEWTDFVPLVTITNDPRAFMVRKDSPYQDMNDLVEDMRKRPNEISIAVGGGFTGSQFRVLLMKKLLDVEFNLTGYKGGGPATAALLGGHVDVFYSNLLARYPLRDKIRNIGVTFSGKHPLFPEAAPCCEQRVFKGKNISCEEMTEIQNHVIYVGRKVKEEYPDRYNMLIEAIEKMRQDPKFQEKVKKAGIDKIAAWWSAEKSEAMQKQIIEGYKKYPDILDIMREK